uniref:SWIB domain-containing protein n=1 Tax=Caenorhabditis tropicalis TaxID=1561998 RepID=A0A1I7TMP0_9PELO
MLILNHIYFIFECLSFMNAFNLHSHCIAKENVLNKYTQYDRSRVKSNLKRIEIMAEETQSSSFPMDKEAAEEEIALLVRKPGFDELTVGDIVRHMNNRFNINFESHRAALKKMVIGEITKRNQEQGNGTDGDGSGSDSSSDSDSDSDSDGEKETEEPKVTKKVEKGKDSVKEVKLEKPAKEAKPVKKEDSDSDSGVEDAVLPKSKKNVSRAQTDMASNIKSSRRAAASEAMKQIRNTSEGGRFSKGKKKTEKDPNADNSGKFGPMTKLCYISPELQQVTKDQWMKRCDVVKVLWDYIKENNLKDPKNGQFIRCDSVLEGIFKKARVKAFGMTKFLTRHIIGTSDMAPDMREEAEQEMDKRRREWKERQRLREAESRLADDSEEPVAKKAKKEESDDDDDEKDVKNEEESSSDKIKFKMSLAGQIAVVTGASRGIGRGIALQLGEAGATVYITGRKPEESLNSKVGLSGLEQTAEEITKRGGKGIARFVDHQNMDEVKNFFEVIERDHDGQLDILVNNAYQGVTAIADNMGKPFYETDPNIWDTINNVGLRNHYFCTVYASRIMVARNKGLIVNVSSGGGLRYLFNVAYGVGKQALDRLSADSAIELEKKNVCVVSLWPGAVRTELCNQKFIDENGKPKEGLVNAEIFANGETVEYPGKAVVALASDPRKMNKTGKILITEDLGREYGFVDIDGLSPANLRSVSFILKHLGWTTTAKFIPSWIKLPGWLIVAGNSHL